VGIQIVTEISSVINIRRRFEIAFLCLMGVWLGGCATTANNQLAEAHMKVPIKILVMQSPITIDADYLQKVFAPETKPELPVSDESISQGVNHAQEYANAAMESALAKEAMVNVVTPPVEDKQLIDNIQSHGLKGIITQDEADHLQAATGADALLRFGITDYGLTPQSWKKGFIAFEVTTTLAVAAVIAYSNSVAAKSMAGVYLVQEAIEETATGYAGFWALDEVCRPVRVEVELIRLNPVTTLWKASDTGLSDVSLSRLFRKVGADERDRQLDQATDYSVKDVVSDFSDALKNNNLSATAKSSMNY
jgi:hypothetical protein